MASNSAQKYSERNPILIAIGGNDPAPIFSTSLAACRWGVKQIQSIPGMRTCGLSRWFVTVPIPHSDQADYINSCIHLIGYIDPVDLLVRLHDIERRAGRVRGAPNAARPLDLDIIAMGETIRRRPDPILPHPRAHQRGFVLAPLADIAPGWRHPITGRTAAEMLPDVDLSCVRALDA